MKIIFGFLFLVLFYGPQSYGKDICDELMAGFSVKATQDVPSPVVVGSTISTELVYKFEDSSVFDNFQFVHASVEYHSALSGNGSSFISSLEFDKESGYSFKSSYSAEISSEGRRSLSFSVPENLVGSFVPSVTVYGILRDDLFLERKRNCVEVIKGKDSPLQEIVVKNQGTKVDMSPPAIGEITLDKESYKLGDQVTMLISVEESSAFADDDSPYVLFVNQDNPDLMIFTDNGFESVPGTNTLSLKFKIENTWKGDDYRLAPGTYSLVKMKLFDVHSNGIFKMPEHIKSSVAITLR